MSNKSIDDGRKEISSTISSPNFAIPQALLGLTGLEPLIKRIGGSPKATETHLLDVHQLEIVANAALMEQHMGMQADQINENLLPIIDAFTGQVHWDFVLQSMNTLSQHMTSGTFQDVWMERLNPYTDLALGLVPHLQVDQVAQCEQVVRNAIHQFKTIDNTQAARAAVKWYDAQPYSHFGAEQQPEDAPTFLRDLLYLVEKDDFDQMGEALTDGNFNEEDFAHLPEKVVEKMIQCFEVTGYVVQRKTGIKLTQQGKDEKILGYDDIQGSLMAFDNMHVPKPVAHETTFDSLLTQNAAAQQVRAVENVYLELDKPTNTVLYLSEILLGENTTDLNFLNRVIETVEQMPAESRPNTIIVSGLIDGGFKYREKDQRAGLAMPLGDQLAGAKVILDRLKATGATVIYNMSDRDREVCRDGTIDAMKMMQDQSKKITDWATYWQVDQMQQNPAWDKHRDFWINVAFQYCLRSGRSLRTADEMAQATNGEVKIDEYLILSEVYRKTLNGENVPPSYEQALEMKNIPFPGKEFEDYRFVDDVNLTTTIKKGKKSREITEWIRHILNFGTKPMYQVPTAAAEDIVLQLHSEGKDAPDRLVNQHQQEGRVIGKRGTDVILTPGFADPDYKLHQRGSSSQVGQTPSWRALTTRRRISKPGALSFTDTMDYRTLVRVFNEALLDKSTISPTRETAAFLFDLQTGSLTSRPDYFVKLLHMISKKLEQGIPIHLYGGGDIIQGWNYKTFPMENAMIGLTSVDSQTKYVSDLISLALGDLSAEALKMLLEVRLIAGNHEINSGSALNGAHHTSYLDDAFRKLFVTKDMLNPPVSLNDTALPLATGELFKSWVIQSNQVGGYGVMVRHMPLEKNGGNGKGGGGSPIDMAAQFLRGVQDLAMNTDALVTGHWHQRQMGVFGNKIAVTSPSLAGESGYEFDRGYRPDIGVVFLHLGGGLPPEVEFLSERTLQTYKVTDGYFSARHLKKLGFDTDDGFDAGRHGFIHRSSPHDALQKILWKFVEDIKRSKETTTLLT